MTKLLGLLGGLLFAFAGVPGALTCIHLRRNPGIPVSTAALIFSGVVCLYGYLFLSYGFDWILTATYTVEAVSWFIVLWYSR